MQISVSSTLTLFHDGQFWVGVIEHREGGEASVARIVFGAEPSDEEVLQLVAKRWHRIRFAGNAEAEVPVLPKNPKRRQREASKELSRRGASTKAQAALQRAREEQKIEARSHRAQERREERAVRFAKRTEKRKRKKRGH